MLPLYFKIIAVSLNTHRERYLLLIPSRSQPPQYIVFLSKKFMLRHTTQAFNFAERDFNSGQKELFQSCQICLVTDLVQCAFATSSFDLQEC